MNAKPSILEQGVPEMELIDTQEIILKLKAVKESEHITIKEIMAMLDDKGENLSETTIRRIFAENSENEDSFSYDRTIRPIAEVLLSEDEAKETKNSSHAKNELLMTMIHEKNGVIERLNEKVELLNDQIEKMRVQLDTVKAEYDRRVTFLRDQIEKKDRRMDEKDQMINLLLEKVLK